MARVQLGRRAVPGILVAGVVVLVGGVALAAIPDASGVIHGCYKLNNPAKGSVLVVDSEASETCPSGFASLNWNQTGPAGPAGEQRYYSATVQNPYTLAGAVGAFLGITVDCDAGDVAVGGGYYIADQNSNLFVTADHPVVGGPDQVKEWQLTFWNRGTTAVDIYAFVRCADLYPYRS